MSLTIKKSLELQRFVLGERPEVRTCRFDNNYQEEKLVAKSAAASETTVVYPGIPKCNVEKQLELQKMILGNT